MKSYSLGPSNYCIWVEHNTLLKLHVGWTFQNKHIAASFPLADALRSKKLAEDTANCRFIQPVSHGVLDQQTTALIPSPTDYQDPVRSKHFHAPWPPRFCNSFLIQITQNIAFFPFNRKKMWCLGWNLKPCSNLTWTTGPWKLFIQHLLYSLAGPGPGVAAAG